MSTGESPSSIVTSLSGALPIEAPRRLIITTKYIPDALGAVEPELPRLFVCFDTSSGRRLHRFTLNGEETVAAA
jgi:hypothetical protein